MAKAARQAATPYTITAKLVRQQVAGQLQRPIFSPGDPDPWDTMTRPEKRDWMLDQIQMWQAARLAQGFENVTLWADQIQFNAQYMIDALTIISAPSPGAGFYYRTVNNNLDGYDELEISARPFV